MAAVNDGASAVSISGTPTVGNTLTAVVGADPDGAGTAPTFQWIRNGVVVGTQATYNPTASDIGFPITVAVAYVDAQGFAENPASAATAAVTSGVGPTINGTNAANVLIGTSLAETINGLGGNDTITANAGNDVANGGAGNDTFFASIDDGNDTYDGGAGTDTYNMVNTSAASNVNLLAGTASSTQTGNDVLISIENVTGSAGDNIIIGNAVANVLRGNGGNDTLDGGSAGADNLGGGTGNDTYIVSHTGMTLTETAGQGTDTVKSSIAFTLGNNFENLTLTGNAAINGTGNNAANVMTGNSAHNVLNANGGNDTLVGSAGGDAYNGGNGIDTLDLSATTNGVNVNLTAGTATGADIGNSTLASIERVLGGSGNDTITANLAPETFSGGAGSDTFIYRTKAAAGGENDVAATRSAITDFLHLTDHIDLTNIDAVANAVGNQDFTFDAVAKAGSGSVADGHLGYFHTTILGVDHTIIEGNITGDAGVVDFQIDLLGNITLTHDDFLGLV